MSMLEHYFHVLDIGSSKIYCAVVAVKRDKLTIKKLSYGPSKGIQHGVVVDLKQAYQSIAKVIDDAEKKMGNGYRIQSVVVNIASPQLHLVPIQKQMTLSPDKPVTLDQLRQATMEDIPPVDGEYLLHLWPSRYILDGTETPNPVGLCGRKLEITLQGAYIPETQKINLETVLDRHAVLVQAWAATPLTAALAMTDEETRQQGCLCLDLGSGLTHLVVYHQGAVVALKSFPVGGKDLTDLMAKHLTCPAYLAERVKVKKGSLLAGGSDEQIILGEDADGEGRSVTQQDVFQILLPAAQEVFDKIADEVKPFGHLTWFLTGGGSHLEGLKEMIAQRYHVPVQTAVRPIPGLPAESDWCLLSGCVGLIHYFIQQQIIKKQHKKHFWQRGIIQWLMNKC